MFQLDRRQFIGRSTGIGVGLAAARQLLPTPHADAAAAGKTTEAFAAFTESFQGWPISEVCEKFKAIGHRN